MSSKHKGKPTTADIIADSLLDWNIDTVFWIPRDGINGFIEVLRQRKDKIKFVLVRHEESAAYGLCLCKITLKTWSIYSYFRASSNSSPNGLYDAKLDNIPVIAI